MNYFKARTPGAEHNIEKLGSRFWHAVSIGDISLLRIVYRSFIRSLHSFHEYFSRERIFKSCCSNGMDYCILNPAPNN